MSLSNHCCCLKHLVDRNTFFGLVATFFFSFFDQIFGETLAQSRLVSFVAHVLQRVPRQLVWVFMSLSSSSMRCLLGGKHSRV